MSSPQFKLPCLENNREFIIERADLTIIEWFTEEPKYDLRYFCPLCECIELKNDLSSADVKLLEQSELRVQTIETPIIDEGHVPEEFTAQECAASVEHIASLGTEQVVEVIMYGR